MGFKPQLQQFECKALARMRKGKRDSIGVSCKIKEKGKVSPVKVKLPAAQALLVFCHCHDCRVSETGS